MAWTTTELLADVRRSGMLPSTSTTGTADADILAHANKELQARLLPLILSVREEFYVRTSDISLVANQEAYRIPSRAIGNKLRDVLLVFSDGTIKNLVRITPEATAELVNTTGPYPWAFYVEQNSIVVVPTPSTSGSATLRMKYFARPASLVAVGATTTPTISSIATNTPTAGTTRITHSASGTSLGTSATFDIVRAKSGFEYAGMDLTFTGSAAGTVDVTASSLAEDFATSIDVGDYISAADTSPVIQVPVEAQNLLYQRTLCRVLQSLGDREALVAAEEDAKRMEEALVGLLSNRVEGEPKKVVGRLLWQPRRRYGRPI